MADKVCNVNFLLYFDSSYVTPRKDPEKPVFPRSCDRGTILKQPTQRQKNHPDSEHSKNLTSNTLQQVPINVGDLVYLVNEGNKNLSRNRYLFTFVDGQLCHIIEVQW